MGDSEPAYGLNSTLEFGRSWRLAGRCRQPAAQVPTSQKSLAICLFCRCDAFSLPPASPFARCRPIFPLPESAFLFWSAPGRPKPKTVRQSLNVHGTPHLRVLFGERSISCALAGLPMACALQRWCHDLLYSLRCQSPFRRGYTTLPPTSLLLRSEAQSMLD